MVLHGRLASWLAMRYSSSAYRLLRTDADAVRVLFLWCARRRASSWRIWTGPGAWAPLQQGQQRCLRRSRLKQHHALLRRRPRGVGLTGAGPAPASWLWVAVATKKYPNLRCARPVAVGVVQ